MGEVLRLSVPLLRADPHRWGSGRVHQIDRERDQTMCGKTPANCPGTAFQGAHDQITCQACLRAIEAKVRSEVIRARVEQEARELEERNRLWWRDYDAYLTSDTWRAKRANGLCEGCGERRATQVHHLSYPSAWPGTDEWIAQEKLFDLRAICTGCHTDIHRDAE